MDAEDQIVEMSVALWERWLAIARHSASAAEGARVSDDELDLLAQSISNRESGSRTERGAPSVPELHSALTAIVAAALALDGFYGTVKPLVQPPESNAARPRKLLEAFKLGFDIGEHAQNWMVELDWLFGIRDYAVHHQTKFEQPYAIRMTEKTVVVGAAESYFLSATNARRAADFADKVTAICVDSPKAPTEQWASEFNAQKRASDSRAAASGIAAGAARGQD